MAKEKELADLEIKIKEDEAKITTIKRQAADNQKKIDGLQ
jgi:uncharacterized coiled-coil protein SlyX